MPPPYGEPAPLVGGNPPDDGTEEEAPGGAPSAGLNGCAVPIPNGPCWGPALANGFVGAFIPRGLERDEWNEWEEKETTEEGID